MNYKNIIAFLIDTSAALIAFYLSLFIRLGEFDANAYIAHGLVFAGIAVSMNYLFKLHRGIWRYFNFYYLYDIIKSASLAIAIFILVSFFSQNLSSIPRSVLIISWFILVTLLALPRALYRFYFDRRISLLFSPVSAAKSPVLIIGLGASAEAFVSELNRIRNGQYKAVGIIDTKPNRGRIVYNVPVLGDISEIEQIVAQLEAKKLRPARMIVSTEFYLGGQLKKLLKVADNLSIPVSRIPKVTELQHNTSTAVPMQPIALEDLLRRPQRALDKELIKQLIANQTVLITGAGGSIGSEIVRQVCENGPAEICLVDNSEFLLYEIEQECIYKYPKLKRHVNLCDIRNAKVVKKIMQGFKPDVVFHAAALKHVPLMEKHKVDAVKTNILGTKNILDAALKNKAKQFVMISTDKAVDPSSFMGATKKFAELYCQAQQPGSTTITIVRFGNVLGSNGSVVPLFEKQIAAGGPITITDKEATRFFMTIREAVGLVLQATTLKTNGSSPRIFVLDMGEPIKIIDLAEHMLMLAGLKPNIDIQIKEIGLRPGEKLHEILITEHESLKKTKHIDIFIANPNPINLAVLTKAIDKLKEFCRALDDNKCAKLVYKIIKG